MTVLIECIDLLYFHPNLVLKNTIKLVVIELNWLILLSEHFDEPFTLDNTIVLFFQASQQLCHPKDDYPYGNHAV